MMLKKLSKNSKRIIKDKKGLSSIELVIGTLVSIVLFAGFLDFLIISNRMQAMSTSMTYLTRVISNQGCLSNDPERTCTINGLSGYKIDYIKNKKFITSREIYDQIEKIMLNEQIPNSDWKVLINGINLTPTTRTNLFDFQDEITIDIVIDFEWKNVSNFLLVNIPKKQLHSNQTTVSLYKFRNEGSNEGFDYGQ